MIHCGCVQIVVNEIKLEGMEGPTVAAAPAGGGATPGSTRGRRRSISDMFSAPAAADPAVEQKATFAELGQKMYDVQQRGIKGAPKKIQVGVTQVRGGHNMDNSPTRWP